MKLIKNTQKKYTWHERVEFVLNYFKEELKKNGDKISEMALSAHLNISRGKLKAWVTGQVPSAEDLGYIVQISTINPVWLFTGLGNPIKKSLPQDDIELEMIPLVSAVLSAGGGSFEVDGNIDRYLAFRRDFLIHKGNIKEMVLMTVSGDSMDPEIKNNDTVLIDQSQTRLMANRIYAVALQDMIYLKKINALPDKIVLESINKDYAPIPIESYEMDNMRIIGRVIWWCREAM